jgi:hypothetical protein
VEAGGIRYAYRKFGTEAGIPLVFFQHLRGGMDNWDPLVTDSLAANRPVILFNNRGLARGTVVFLAGPELTEENILYTFFAQSQTSQATGRACWRGSTSAPPTATRSPRKHRRTRRSAPSTRGCRRPRARSGSRARRQSRSPR